MRSPYGISCDPMTADLVPRNGEPTTGTRSAADPSLLDASLASLLEARTLARYRWIAPLVAGRRVLDVGGGAGGGAAMLVGAGAAEVVAAEETAAMVEVVRSQAPPGVEARRTEPDSLPFPCAAFDVVLSLGAKQPDDLDRIAELLRVVKPEGLLVVSVQADAVERVRGRLSEQRSYVALADQRELAGSEVRCGSAPDDALEDRVVPTASIPGGNPPPPGSATTIAIASESPIPSLDPVAVAFDLGSMDLWLQSTKEHERRMRQLESRIADLQAELDDRELRRELRTTEQSLAMRISSYEEAVQNASLQTAERYRNTISWKLTTPLRRSKPNLKSLARRVVRSAS